MTHEGISVAIVLLYFAGIPIFVWEVWSLPPGVRTIATAEDRFWYVVTVVLCAASWFVAVPLLEFWSWLSKDEP